MQDLSGLKRQVTNRLSRHEMRSYVRSIAVKSRKASRGSSSSIGTSHTGWLDNSMEENPSLCSWRSAHGIYTKAWVRMMAPDTYTLHIRERLHPARRKTHCLVRVPS